MRERIPSYEDAQTNNNRQSRIDFNPSSSSAAVNVANAFHPGLRLRRQSQGDAGRFAKSIIPSKSSTFFR